MLTKDEQLLPTLVIIAIILILLTGVTCPPPQTIESTQYAKSGIVTSVDRKTDTVTFVDRSDN